MHALSAWETRREIQLIQPIRTHVVFRSMHSVAGVGSTISRATWFTVAAVYPSGAQKRRTPRKFNQRIEVYCRGLWVLARIHI